MAKEIERKFLVMGDGWRENAVGTHYRQGYLNSVKGLTVGCTRLEFEYSIPYDDCVKMLDELAEKPIIEKTRYKIPAGNGLTWEIDEFHGVNEGLIVAEIEVPSEDTSFEKPDWLGEEVSSDPRYFNSNLVSHPYTTWNK